ncbi:MAG: M20/M25/M40 family metallo-hydrolase [Bacteroidia bacterium]|nr:M20/M25/M40 family metallo-hydrolase [Bacteroidia bacterium]
MQLLKQLQSIHAPSGGETPLRDFLIKHINEQQSTWRTKPRLYYGAGFQDTLILVFGIPRTAVFAHLDSIGFTVRYDHQLVKIGGPRTETGYKLIGKDAQGDIECELIVNEDKSLSYQFEREIERGTSLTFKPDWREDDSFIQNCYMDNRLGIYNALELCKTLEHGAIVFTCWEETGGGSAEVAGKWLYENFGISQALISDITWVTDGVIPGKGVAISMRDIGHPRHDFVNKIIALTKQSELPFQLEVESSGGSDGNALQRISYPWDWCFIGAPEDHVHSPNEKVHKQDIESMIALYQYLMKKL